VSVEPDASTEADELLRRLHSEVDADARRLSALHAARLVCRIGCSECCVDGLTVFEVEADNIRRHHPDLLAAGLPHPEGRCAFLEAAGACRIYAHRPYVCRTQGLPLRWIEERPDGGGAELRDICPLNEAGPPIETLPESACWTLGPVEGRLAQLQASRDGGRLRRVPLRALFQAPAGGEGM
jgi:hypothetical protein